MLGIRLGRAWMTKDMHVPSSAQANRQNNKGEDLARGHVLKPKIARKTPLQKDMGNSDTRYGCCSDPNDFHLQQQFRNATVTPIMQGLVFTKP